MKTKKLFYIGKRSNPQLTKPYYRAYGQLTKKEASKKETCLYGSMQLTSYNTKEEYIEAIQKLNNDGFKVIEL